MKSLKEWLNRKPSGPKLRKRIPKVSKRREGANREYAKRRKAFLLAHPYCQAWKTIRSHLNLPTIGLPPSTEIHHTKKPRCKYLNDESTWLAVCRCSHDWIEDHKTDARMLKLLQ